MLLPTPLRGPNGDVVAIAQGPLSIGGFGGGSGGNNVSGESPDGRPRAERRAGARRGADADAGRPTRFASRSKDPDFISASQVAQAVNRELGDGSARARRSRRRSSVSVPEPVSHGDSRADGAARAAAGRQSTPSRASSSTSAPGTVVVGGAVRLGPAAVAHGNLSVRISTRLEVSQPTAFSRTATRPVVPQRERRCQRRHAASW